MENKIANLLNSNKKINMGFDPIIGKIVWFIDSVKENGNETIVESHTSFGFKFKTAFITNGDYIEIANYEPYAWIGGAMVEWVANHVDMLTEYNRKNPSTFTVR